MGWNWVYLALLVAGIACLAVAAVSSAQIKPHEGRWIAAGFIFFGLVWAVEVIRVLNGS